MTSLAIDHFATAWSSRREARELRYGEDLAVDELSARTLWCATGLTRGQHAAREMLAQLRGVAEGAELMPRELKIAASGPLLELTERLDKMLLGERGAPALLTAADREICADAKANSDVLVGDEVRADDMVVLHDPLAVMLTEALRERGAHTVWHLRVMLGPARARSTQAKCFLRGYTGPLHAYVTDSRRPARGHRVAALIPSIDVLAVKETDDAPSSDVGRGDRLAWASALAEVIRADRAETVGGTLHARPAVVAR